LVLTPLRTADGAVLPVVRGWVAESADTDPPPMGEVRLTGYLQVSEEAGSGVADGRTDAISSAELLNVWQGPIWTGYLVLVSSDPPQSSELALLDPPRRPGSGLNVQNLAYAVQWWVFGLFCAALWVRLVRDEAAGAPRAGRQTAAAGTPLGAPAERAATVAITTAPITTASDPTASDPTASDPTASGPTASDPTAGEPVDEPVSTTPRDDASG
jgi:hypothetical protein